ncbi:Prepilin signal peptidase PulO (type II secretory pathway) [Friedmanniella luteola]|uniref:Prepilin signal peptidase PulO (Type II secretory pathway) n=1 Tax=Friedmanniella luteola TaxID=546871 RepID=A0A1H1LB64_9ACTN|nr:A24 family peptidase [Friedmanniella luteola]SDR71794.1 Prepilin signal peptidase PulO (type II secretory pathway) [Friedmanniella luteola]
MPWVWPALAGLLGALAGLWLRGRGYRRPDDEQHLVVRPWSVPVLAVLGAVAAGPFLADQPAVVLGTLVLALVWAVVLAVVDLEVRRLPDRLVLPAYPVAALLLTACSVVTGEPLALLRALTCAGAGVLGFLLVALLSPGGQGLGLGDVKLAGVLGGLLGWWGWSDALLGLLGGFVLGGLGALVLLVARRVDRRGAIALGPALLLGAYLALLSAPLT